ncbi:hypothetical protein [Anaerosacchariphilus polymeriproducens]|uniref:hypothetical protein n=1 Tax=Anaerosacchariphilus polymeriproducens TaxID=1812858 RepID=UPI0012D7C591|nr:hypothetical protein [Anaerosacchariphilus polymeriproducens]
MSRFQKIILLVMSHCSVILLTLSIVAKKILETKLTTRSCTGISTTYVALT